MTFSPGDRARIAGYRAANRYLNQGLIRAVASAEDAAPSSPKLSRRERMLAFLPRLDHPQRAFAAVHVGGTSGKGSTATMIAEILAAGGVSAGLHVTPYLQVATEKLWADGRYASAEEFAALVDWIRPHAEAERGAEVPMHGMASVAIALEFFRRRRVRYGVMEVGVGGRHDLTNVLETAVAVIGPVGLDHLKTLGSTVEEIAWHKAGIIQRGAEAVVLEGPGLAAARRQAEAVGAKLRVVSDADYAIERAADGELRLSFFGRRRRLEGLRLGMIGDHQAQNAALALAAVEALEARDGLNLDQRAIRRGLARARLPGRAELFAPLRPNGAPVMLDGAHNPDKLAALFSALDQRHHRALHVIFGGLGSRAPNAALARLAGRATTFFCTEPRVYCKRPRPAAEIAAVVEPWLPARVEARPSVALDHCAEIADAEDLILVTGSLYLVGELRGRWITPEQVLLQQQRTTR